MFLKQLGYVLIAELVFAGAAIAAPATRPTAPTTAPTTAPAAVLDQRIGELIQQLGDERYATREEAAAELQKLGDKALPALKEAAQKSDEPEVKARAQALATTIEKQLAANPGWRVGRVPPFGRQRIQVSINNGQKETIAEEPGRTVRITENAQGIAMVVQETRDGKEVTTEYKAASSEELRKNDPDAYAFYERYGNRAGVVLVPPMAPVPPVGPPPPPGPVPPVPPVAPMPPGMGNQQEIQRHMEEMLKNSPLPDDMKQRIIEQNRRFDQMHERLMQQQLQMMQRMDEARQQMEERMWPRQPAEPQP